MSGIAMGQRYSQLTLEERCRLRGLIEMRLSKVEIARRLGRHRSTVDRELARNSNVDGYRPDTADRRAWVRRFRGSRIERSTRLSADIEDRLAMGWSPEQIAGRMELEGVEHAVCTESIYRHVFSPAGRRAGLPKLLPQHKSLRGRRARNGRREPSIPNRSSIDQRPKSAEDRQEFGHWEGDLMRFRRQRDILLTLQERSTRLTLARRLHSKDAPATADAIVDKLDGHETVKARIGLAAYFCDPHSPWQRGGIENGNGLPRRVLPRKARLCGYQDIDIYDIVWMLNSTPRKCLGFQTPIEAFAQHLGVALEK